MVNPFESPLLPPVPVPAGGSLLSLLLAQLIAGGLAAVLVHRFLNAPAGVRLTGWLIRELVWFGLGKKEVTRYAAIVLSAFVSLMAYMVALGFGLVPNPGSVEAWANLVLTLLGIGFTGSQVLHAREKVESSDDG